MTKSSFSYRGRAAPRKLLNTLKGFAISLTPPPGNVHWQVARLAALKL